MSLIGLMTEHDAVEEGVEERRPVAVRGKPAEEIGTADHGQAERVGFIGAVGLVVPDFVEEGLDLVWFQAGLRHGLRHVGGEDDEAVLGRSFRCGHVESFADDAAGEVGYSFETGVVASGRDPGRPRGELADVVLGRGARCVRRRARR